MRFDFMHVPPHGDGFERLGQLAMSGVPSQPVAQSLRLFVRV
jgi:hypothetical protein